MSQDDKSVRERAGTRDALWTPRSASRRVAESIAPGRNRLDVTVFYATGKVLKLPPVFNSRTAAGALWQAGIMGQASGSPANYLAISTDTTAVANGDTTLASEITTNGLARKAATYGGFVAQSQLGGGSTTPSAANQFQYTLTALFTYTGSTEVDVTKAALLTAASGGILVFEALINVAKLTQSGDAVQVVWTVQG